MTDEFDDVESFIESPEGRRFKLDIRSVSGYKDKLFYAICDMEKILHELKEGKPYSSDMMVKAIIDRSTAKHARRTYPETPEIITAVNQVEELFTRIESYKQK